MKPNRPEIDARRRMVAEFMLKGFALDAITDALAPHFRHPKSGKPYTRNAIYRDFVALRKQWREDAAADIAELRGRQLAELLLVRKQAWLEKDLDKVLRSLAQESKLLGTNKPLEMDITMLVRTLAEEAAKLAGFSDEAAAAVAARAEELAQ